MTELELRLHRENLNLREILTETHRVLLKLVEDTHYLTTLLVPETLSVCQMPDAPDAEKSPNSPCITGESSTCEMGLPGSAE